MKHSLLLAATGLVASSTLVFASVPFIGPIDFEGETPGETDTNNISGIDAVDIAFSSTGTLTPAFGGVSANGNPGNAIELDVDSTGESFWGGRIRSNFLDTGGGGTSDLSQLQISFDIQVAGTNSGSANLELGLTSRTAGFALSGSTGNEGFSVTEGAYQTVTFLASDINGGGDLVGDDAFLTFEIRWNQGSFGFDAGNVVRVDNIQFKVIPEPSTYAAIFGGLALGLVLLRRRLRKA